MSPQFSHRETLNRRPNQQRTRKSKMKIVRQMTKMELDADSSSWRRYGQKAIKGLPLPRTYYRCRASKGCGARKLVDHSPNNPEVFMVTYTGAHTHPKSAYIRSAAKRRTSTKRTFGEPGTANNNGNSSTSTISAQKASVSLMPTLPDLNLPPPLDAVKIEDVEEAPTTSSKCASKKMRI